jgi:hypothetical chaperone protein
MKNNILYGIDFGTTNSVLAIYDESKGEIIDTISVPSILYFPENHDPTNPISYYVGNEAILHYVQEGMKGRFMKSIKRVLPNSSFLETRIHNQKYTAADLVSLILKALKDKADQIVGFTCEKVVMGRPVFFDDYNTLKDDLAQKRLLQAAQKVGFTEVRFQFEPIGAAFLYERTIKQKEKVLVADLGGGTTDFTYIALDPTKINSTDRRKDIIATGGVYVGGDSFDSTFMWEKGTPYFGRGLLYESMPGKYLDVPLVFFSNICSWEKMNFYNGLKVKLDLQKYYNYTNKNEKLAKLITLTENNLGYSIFQSIEKTKIALSKENTVDFKYMSHGIRIDENISLENYNTIIAKDVDKISMYLETFLAKNNIVPSDIDTLFLTGGTSLVKIIQSLFKTKFPNVTVKSDNNFISVANGLAYCGYLFDGEN